MDQTKIGKFIAEKRKDAGLTQSELAERIGITNRAVSKWECGISMPDSSIMLELCEILNISVNELLKGEDIDVANYSKELEGSLIEMVKEKERGDKMLLNLEVVIGVLSMITLFIPIFIGALAPIEEEWIRLLIVFSGFIPAFVGFFFAVKIEQIAGYYECRHCGHKYVPTYKDVSFSMHMGRTRYMTCPECGKKSWQKKKINKN